MYMNYANILTGCSWVSCVLLLPFWHFLCLNIAGVITWSNFLNSYFWILWYARSRRRNSVWIIIILILGYIVIKSAKIDLHIDHVERVSFLGQFDGPIFKIYIFGILPSWKGTGLNNLEHCYFGSTFWNWPNTLPATLLHISKIYNFSALWNSYFWPFYPRIGLNLT